MPEVIELKPVRSVRAGQQPVDRSATECAKAQAGDGLRVGECWVGCNNQRALHRWQWYTVQCASLIGTLHNWNLGKSTGACNGFDLIVYSSDRALQHYFSFLMLIVYLLWSTFVLCF
ncbi:MAG: hypothetical protein H6937_01030 [Burkholderiales bacterium]|nr:hypothetical protein [Burkholderiales bacterium]